MKRCVTPPKSPLKGTKEARWVLHRVVSLQQTDSITARNFPHIRLGNFEYKLLFSERFLGFKVCTFCGNGRNYKTGKINHS